MRKGERSQEKYFYVNARKLNRHLTVLTGAAEAFLQARAEGSDPVTAVLAKVSEQELQTTVDYPRGLELSQSAAAASVRRRRTLQPGKWQ